VVRIAANMDEKEKADESPLWKRMSTHESLQKNTAGTNSLRSENLSEEIGWKKLRLPSHTASMKYPARS
jgi:hypothetical protein